MLIRVVADQMVRQWRREAALSQYALALRTGTPPSTIRRIELGETDPTITMLERIASAAGRRLDISTSQIDLETQSLAAIAEQIRRRGEIDWTELRGFADWTEQNPHLARLAITTPPLRTGSTKADNLLAAIAEITADTNSEQHPRWTRAVRPLDEPWFTDGTPMMQARSARNVPVQFAARNICFGANTVWHASRRVLA